MACPHYGGLASYPHHSDLWFILTTVGWCLILTTFTYNPHYGGLVTQCFTLTTETFCFILTIVSYCFLLTTVTYCFILSMLTRCFIFPAVTCCSCVISGGIGGESQGVCAEKPEVFGGTGGGERQERILSELQGNLLIYALGREIPLPIIVPFDMP